MTPTNKSNTLAIMVEYVRSALPRLCGCSIGITMGDFPVDDPSAHTVELSTPIFGGLKATAELKAIDFSNARRLEDQMLFSIEKAVDKILEQAELIALVDYKWPKAA